MYPGLPTYIYITISDPSPGISALGGTIIIAFQDLDGYEWLTLYLISTNLELVI